ncbi:MAG TPA: cytochrome C oxidase subunit II [Sideroxyarcus sp.]|nr:cytochrome C oxidase subunit II [Sideroxyarcus sp.]
MYQQVAWMVSIVLIALLAVAFFYVVRHSSSEGDGAAVAAATGRWRGRLLWGVTLLCIPIVAYTLTELPYARRAIGNLDTVEVQAKGHQWYWEISQTEFPAGKQIEFQVTSADVNHGFAIYDTDMKIVTQTQAMPGVTNVLRYTFEKPGTYKILCLEYCGVAHHSMMTELHVLAQ